MTRTCTVYTFEYENEDNNEDETVSFMDIPLVHNNDTTIMDDWMGVEIPEAISEYYNHNFQFMEANFISSIHNHNIYYDVELGRMVNTQL